jgi:hypothetical protein
MQKLFWILFTVISFSKHISEKDTVSKTLCLEKLLMIKKSSLFVCVILFSATKINTFIYMPHPANPTDKVTSYRPHVSWRSVANCWRAALPAKRLTWKHKSKYFII